MESILDKPQKAWLSLPLKLIKCLKYEWTDPEGNGRRNKATLTWQVTAGAYLL